MSFSIVFNSLEIALASDDTQQLLAVKQKERDKTTTNALKFITLFFQMIVVLLSGNKRQK
jgi:hypothetical protein